MKILFVDNSRTTRAVMAKTLEEKGFEVETAGNGAEAIEMVKSKPFDVVVMDLYMPTMNGYEAAQQIRDLAPEENNEVPIIALSASQDEKDISLSKESGMNEFIIKSSDNNELFAAIEKYKK